MFFLILLVLQALVITEAICACRLGLFNKKQAAKKVWKVQVGLFVENGAMWGDFFYISPLVAWAITRYHNSWSPLAIMISCGASFGITTFMFLEWRKRSEFLYDCFFQDKKIFLSAWLHYIYMITCLAVIFLAYFATAHVSRTFANVITASLVLHMILGTVQPEINSHGRLSTFTVIYVLLAYAGLAIGWWHLAH